LRVAEAWLRNLGTYGCQVFQRLRPSRGDASQNWLAFLANHREVIVAFDFFTVPTLTFKLLYCFFVIEHGRRKVLHSNVTSHPTSEWVVQQLRQTFREADPYRCVIFDHDSKFNSDAIALFNDTWDGFFAST
jgi:hypothetical protein